MCDTPPAPGGCAANGPAANETAITQAHPAGLMRMSDYLPVPTPEKPWMPKGGPFAKRARRLDTTARIAPRDPRAPFEVWRVWVVSTIPLANLRIFGPDPT
jgi:hypothetical protein